MSDTIETKATPVQPETPVEPAKTEVPPAIAAEPVAEDLPKQDEKSMLMSRAKLMGIKFSNNITVEKLKAKIDEHMKKVEAEEDPETEPEQSAPDEDEIIPAKATDVVPAAIAAQAPKARPETRQELRERLRKESLKLIRLRITNLDPKKKDLPGEIFTIANRYIGTVRKFIPFGEQTANGYHVPNCIYNEMKDRKFLHIRVVKSKDSRKDHVEQTMVPEFSLEVLPPLTKDELKKLAAQQAATGSTKDE